MQSFLMIKKQFFNHLARVGWDTVTLTIDFDVRPPLEGASNIFPRAQTVPNETTATTTTVASLILKQGACSVAITKLHVILQS